MPPSQDTGTMKPGRVAIIVAIIVVVGGTSYGLKRYRCSQRRAAFARQVESIKQGAHEHLGVGTEKADVARFFTERSIPLSIEGAYAYGSIRTSGCAPFGCGTDSAFISVRVRLDRAGAVADEPIVGAIYTDCL
jgi:hypothetical protein